MTARRGTTVWCPLCDGRWDRFKDDWNRPAALCWRCGSHERHRAQWLILQQEGLLAGPTALLHFAPEFCLRSLLRRAACAHPGFEYLTADLDPAGVDLQVDLSRPDQRVGTFDAVLCSHVLEHVPDDAIAMAALRQMTAPGGWCVVMVPLDLEREQTYEDPSLTTSEQRLAAFGQRDHVRQYAGDIEHRLAAAGFDVEVIRPGDALPGGTVRAAGLLASDWVFVCR
jgi:SAM-dependent methyltransferase